MSDALLVGIAASVGPTLIGVGAVVQATRGRREAAAANRAVNHQAPGSPSIVEKVDILGEQLELVKRLAEGTNEEVRTVTTEVASIREDMVLVAEHAAELHVKVDRHLAYHQGSFEATVVDQTSPPQEGASPP